MAIAPRLPYWVVSRLLGLLLMTAAVLKAYGLTISPIGPGGVFSAPGFQVGLIEFEGFLSVWLLWGKYPIGSWMTAIIAFGAFAVVSVYQAWIGQTSCGCFGALSVAPWQALALDGGAALLLVAGRPEATRDGGKCTGLVGTGLRGLLILGGVMAILAMFAVATFLSFGSSEAALAYFRGEHLSPAPQLVDLGEGEPGEVKETTVDLVNRTGRPIRVIGGTSDCSCVTTSDLPMTIPAGQTRAFAVKLAFPKEQRQFTRKATLITDDDQSRVVVFRLTGRTSVRENGRRESERAD